ncbi:class I SAM-dependent methyltransferase [Mesobacillus foraminis]|uniref:Tellurite resistance protein TehB n=1 Tax=Mesobacillus foraminis TaxID=279826 RepID=A0A4R2B7E9_9BACI|nr:methyltransferase domain-containing protein [Mesobacillus foraminis]TCN22631.1 tellurite resistance protein TehB [Mesobacillus foraminis]
MDPKTKWNKKYNERLIHLETPVPNARLIQLSSYLGGGTALDLACGLGGNSLFLAKLNYSVQAMDISDVAVKYLQGMAEKEGVAVSAVTADLENISSLLFENNSFDLLVITYYLNRPLLSLVKSLLKEDGYFFMETYYHSPKNGNQKIPSRYKLQSNELLDQFKEWKVLYFEENEEEGRQTIFCQKTGGVCT